MNKKQNLRFKNFFFLSERYFLEENPPTLRKIYDPDVCLDGSLSTTRVGSILKKIMNYFGIKYIKLWRVL